MCIDLGVCFGWRATTGAGRSAVFLLALGVDVGVVGTLVLVLFRFRLICDRGLAFFSLRFSRSPPFTLCGNWNWNEWFLICIGICTGTSTVF